jgi:hypothetical protein
VPGQHLPQHASFYRVSIGAFTFKGVSAHVPPVFHGGHLVPVRARRSLQLGGATLP